MVLLLMSGSCGHAMVLLRRLCELEFVVPSGIDYNVPCNIILLILKIFPTAGSVLGGSSSI